MPSQFDAVARINLDLRSFRAGTEQVTRSGGEMERAFRGLHNVLNSVEVVEKKLASEISRSLRLYGQAASVTNTFARSVQALSKHSESAAKGARLMGTAFGQLRSALSSVTGLSKKEAERLTRTLALYERMANVVHKLSSAYAQMAAVNQRSQKLEQEQAAAHARSAQAAARAAQAEQRLAIQRQNAGAAASRAAAQQASAQARLASAEARLVAAQQAAARSSRTQARSTQSAATAFDHLESSAYGVRSALGDLGGIYQNLAQGLKAIGTASLSAAIDHENAFAQIERVTEMSSLGLQQMRRDFEQLTAALPVGFDELTRIGQLASQTGVANDELVNFTDTVVRFSVTTGVASDEVALLFGRIRTMRNIPISQMDNFASAILALGVSSASTENEILRVTESISTATAIFGLSTEATAGLASALATLRVRPHLARGALTRIFRELTDAVGESGSRLKLLSRVLGLTEDKVTSLMRTNPDDFFLKFIKGLGRTTGNAGNLTRVLGRLGINAVRDIDTISRLANNYDTLADQVGTAYAEFALGTKLQKQSETIFQTTKVRIDNLKDAFETFIANAGKPFVGLIGGIAGVLTNVLELINNVPGPVMAAGAAFAAFVAIRGGMVLYRLAIIKTLSAAASLKAAQDNLGLSTVSLRGAIGALNRVRRGEIVQTEGAATAVRQYATAQEQAAVAANAAARASAVTSAAASTTAASYSTLASRMRTTQAANLRMNASFSESRALLGGYPTVLRNTTTALQRTATTSATVAAAMANTASNARNQGVSMRGLSNVITTYNAGLVTNQRSQAELARVTTVANAAIGTQAAVATEASVATRVFGTAVSFLKAQWGLLLGIGLPLVLVASSLVKGFSDAAGAAKKAGDQAFQAAGGLAELGRAIAEDQIQGKKAGKTYRTITASLGDLDAARRQQAGTLKDNADKVRQLDKTLGGLTESSSHSGEAAKDQGAEISKSGAATAIAKKKSQSYTQALDGMTFALRDNTKAFYNSALRAAVLKTELSSTRAEVKALKAQTPLLKDVLSKAFKDPQGALKDLDGGISKLNDQIAENARKLSILKDARGATGIQQQKAISALEKENKALGDQKTYLANVRAALIKTGGATELAAINNELFGSSAEEAAAKYKKFVGDAADGASDLGAATVEIPDNIKAMADAYTQIGGPIKAWQDAVTEANRDAKESVDDFAKAANTSLDLYMKKLREQVTAQQNWATNLIRLSGRVSADVLTTLAQMGPEAAPLLQKLVDATDTELSEWEALFRSSSTASGIALSDGLTKLIPALSGKGKKVGEAIANSIAREMKRDVEEGGGYKTAIAKMTFLLDALGKKKVKPKVLLNFLKVEGDLKKMQAIIDKAEKDGSLDAKGKATLETFLYRTAMRKLEDKVAAIKKEHKVDANGKAHLDKKGYEKDLAALKKSAAVTILKGLLNVKGHAGLNDDEYKAVLKFLKLLKIDTERKGKLDPHGDAHLDKSAFTGNLYDLRSLVYNTTRGGKLSPHGRASISTRGFYDDLSDIRYASYTTGNRIQANLTRSATVSVGYYYYQKNSPPRTAYAASGGWIAGPGGPRDDKVPAMLSDGEFVVNAKQAARYRALLEAINSGHYGRGYATLASGGNVSSKQLQPMTLRSADLNKAISSSLVQRLPSRGATQREYAIPARSGPVITIHNQYPQAEPTSVTINRSLAYAATIHGV